MRKLSVTLAAIATLLAPTGTAFAQADPAAWVNRILVEWDDIQRKDGWAPQGEIRPGMLASGTEALLDYPLTAGRTYGFVVVCEPACGAGEVQLLDPAGARVGEARPLAEMPKLQVVPAAAGTYRLRVAMSDCSKERCAWSARLYSKAAERRTRRK